jgi:hypothetical protein
LMLVAELCACCHGLHVLHPAHRVPGTTNGWWLGVRSSGP